MSFVLVLVLAATAAGAPAARLIVDADADGREDAAPAAPAPAAPAPAGLTGAGADGPGPASAFPCAFPDTAPYPYCHSGRGGALGFRPALGSDPDLVFFMTQTSGDEDVVWLAACNAMTEHARCCPRGASFPNLLIGGMSYNGFIACNGTDTVFTGNVTTLAGRLFEMAVFPPGAPLSGSKCQGADPGEDEIACGADARCAFRREFTIPGLGEVDGMAVMAPAGHAPFLAIANRDDSTVYFADPAQPSCTAATVAVLGSCRLMDGATLVRASDLAWAGDNRLLAACDQTDRIYEFAVDLATFSCSAVSSCPAPGPDVHGLAYDRAGDRIWVADATQNLIHFTAVPGAPCINLAVRFASFAAGLSADGRVAVTWATRSEEETIGFSVERGAQRSGPFAAVAAVAASGAGHGYRFEDDDPGAAGASGEAPWYRLVEWTTSGRGDETAAFPAVGPAGTAAPGDRAPRSRRRHVRPAVPDRPLRVPGQAR